MMPITMPGTQRIESGQAGNEPLQQRRHEHQREVAIHDRRHARQNLEHRLDDAADARAARTRSDKWR